MCCTHLMTVIEFLKLCRNKKQTTTTTKLKRIFQDARDYLLMSKLFSCKYNSEEEKKTANLGKNLLQRVVMGLA